MGHDSKIAPLDNQCSLRNLWVGIGCKRGTSKVVIEQAIASVFQAYALAEHTIAGIATIDTKADEVGLLAFCHDRQLPLRFFSAEVLRSVAIPNPSSAIDTAVGTPSVAEAAALLACLCGEGEMKGEGDKELSRGENSLQHSISTPYIVRLSAHVEAPYPTPHLCLSKQRYRCDGDWGCVTIAVAIASITPSPQVEL